MSWQQGAGMAGGGEGSRKHIYIAMFTRRLPLLPLPSLRKVNVFLHTSMIWDLRSADRPPSRPQEHRHYFRSNNERTNIVNPV